MYELKIVTFELVQSEYFLEIMNNFKIWVDGTGTTMTTWNVNYLLNLLSWEALR